MVPIDLPEAAEGSVAKCLDHAREGRRAFDWSKLNVCFLLRQACAPLRSVRVPVPPQIITTFWSTLGHDAVPDVVMFMASKPSGCRVSRRF